MAKEILKLSELQSKSLKEMGRRGDGKLFVEILREAKRQYSDINTIDTDRDTNAQIEGRQIMGDLCDELINYLTPHNKRRVPGDLRDDWT